MQESSILYKIQLLHRIRDTFMHVGYHWSLEKFFFPCFAWKGSGITRTKGHIILQRRRRLLRIDLAFLRLHCKGIIQGRLWQLWKKNVNVKLKDNIWTKLDWKDQKDEFTHPIKYIHINVFWDRAINQCKTRRIKQEWKNDGQQLIKRQSP